jgi:hypothetical protein
MNYLQNQRENIIQQKVWDDDQKLVRRMSYFSRIPIESRHSRWKNDLITTSRRDGRDIFMVNVGETIPKTPISGEMNKYYGAS